GVATVCRAFEINDVFLDNDAGWIINLSEMHRHQRHLFENDASAALGDFTVVMGSRGLTIARVAAFADDVETANELRSINLIAEILQRIRERTDARFFILLRGRSGVAFDLEDHLARDVEMLEVEPRELAQPGDVLKHAVPR